MTFTPKHALLGPGLRQTNFVRNLLCLTLLAVSGCQSEMNRQPDIDAAGPATGETRWVATTSTDPVPAYAADDSCADCHPGIHETYQSVGMRRSFYPFDTSDQIEELADGQFFHPASNNHYEMRLRDGSLLVTRFRLREDGTRMNDRTESVDFVIGSGHHVRSYIYRNDAGEMFQFPIAWYTQERAWGMAPGYDRHDHQGFDRPITRHCMFCHNAYPTWQPGDDHFGALHLFPAELPHGIGCQRCHGPGAEHVRLASAEENDPAQVRDAIVNPARLSPSLRDDVCLQCHLQPSSARTSFVRKPGQTDYGYQPGQPLSDYLAYLELDELVEATDRFEINHHPYRLYQSACYRQSDGELSCLTCHDPHGKVAEGQRAAHYRARCLTCHGPNDCLDKERGAIADANCVACHMPRRRTQDVVHVVMTDHNIARPIRGFDPIAPLDEDVVPANYPLRAYHRPGGPDRAL